MWHTGNTFMLTLGKTGYVIHSYPFNLSSISLEIFLFRKGHLPSNGVPLASLCLHRSRNSSEGNVSKILLIFWPLSLQWSVQEYKLHIDVKNLPFHLDLCRPFAAHWWDNRTKIHGKKFPWNFFLPRFFSSLKQIFLPGKQNSFVDPFQFIGDIDGIIGSNQILVIAYLAE